MTQSIFSPYNPQQYKQGPRNNNIVKGQFGGAGMGAPQGNLQAIMDLIKRFSTPAAPQTDELTRNLEELRSPAVTGRF